MVRATMEPESDVDTGSDLATLNEEIAGGVAAVAEPTECCERIDVEISSEESRTGCHAAIYVGARVMADTGELRWSARAFLFVDDQLPVEVMSGDEWGQRNYAIEDCSQVIAAHLAKSRRKALKEASRMALDFSVAVSKVSVTEPHAPAGEACEWPTGELPAPFFGITDPAIQSDIAAAGMSIGTAIAGGEDADVGADAPAGELPAEESKPADAPAPVTPPSTDPQATPQAIKHFRRRMTEANERLADAVLHRASCDAALKSAKATEKLAMQDLQQIRSRGPEVLPLFDKKPAIAKPTGEGEANSAASDPAPATSDIPQATTDGWRSVSIDALGLPPKLAERLTEAGLSTLGSLEDQRANGGFRKVEGIGKVKAESITEALLVALTEHRDAAVMEAAAASNGDASAAG